MDEVEEDPQILTEEEWVDLDSAEQEISSLVPAPLGRQDRNHGGGGETGTDLARDNALRALVLALDHAGWNLRAVEIDTFHGTARVEAARADGLFVTLDARNGRTTLTREMIDHETVTVGRRGDRTRVERISTRFIGRLHCEGLRSGLRVFCGYLTDNALRVLPAPIVRALFAPLMEPPDWVKRAVKGDYLGGIIQGENLPESRKD